MHAGMAKGKMDLNTLNPYLTVDWLVGWLVGWLAG
jgi:hypothetical protein